MRRSPTVSVIMSVYNGEKYLKEALLSILNQSYKDFEFIIINDGSSDGSRGIIEDIQKIDKRISLINQENSGLVAALNKGMAEASGKYIARMDADDLSIKDRFNQQVQYLDSHPDVHIVGTGFIFFDQAGNELGRQGVLTQDDDIKRELCIRNPYGHGSVMMRKDIFEILGGYSGSVGPVEDYDLWIKSAEKFKLGGISDYLYKWRINPEGISQNSIEIQNRNTRRLADLFIDKFNSERSTVELIKRRNHYRKMDGSTYRRYVEDQYLFFNVYLRRKNYLGLIYSLLFILMTPGLLLELGLKKIKGLLWMPLRLSRIIIRKVL